MTRRQKPIIHGRDHASDGPDPIPSVATDAIKFNTRPQDGGWLYVNTTGQDPDTVGYGIEMYSVRGIQFVTSGNTFADDVSIIAQNAAVDISGDSGVIISANGNDGIQLDAQGFGNIIVQAGTNSGVTITLTNPARLEITGLPTTNPGGTGIVWNNGGVLNIT